MLWCATADETSSAAIRSTCMQFVLNYCSSRQAAMDIIIRANAYLSCTAVKHHGAVVQQA
jgi:hypothetical protein